MTRRLYEVIIPLRILGKTYERGEMVDFTGGPIPKNLIDDGTLIPVPEREVLDERERAISRKGLFQ
jgi:hypothetical protein